VTRTSKSTYEPNLMFRKPLTIFASFPNGSLTDHLSSGDGLIAYQIIRQLANRGHIVHVATPKAELQNPVPEGVTLHEMRRQSGLPRPGVFEYMKWTRRVLRDVRRSVHVDLVHELNPVYSLCSLAFEDSGLPVVLGPHFSRWPNELNRETNKMRVLREQAKNALKDLCISRQHRSASAVLLSTPAALNNVVDPEQLKGKLFILPPGVDAEEFTPAPQVEVKYPTILFLARVVAEKGIYSLLEAFSQLLTTIPEARLMIAGDGPDLPAVRERVAQSSWKHHVEFHGRIPHANVPAMMHRCTVYCLPSHGEPFGMTAIEAMACGKPLVVTNAGGLAYMVSHEGGRRVEVGDSSALAEALGELVADPDLCARMGKHNRRLVEKIYSWPHVTSSLEQIYAQVLHGHALENPDLVTDKIIRSYRTLLNAPAGGGDDFANAEAAR
jgi:glycosyltransferase involved in cell wall biosynthesis